jgi:DNA-binding transcriptional ArsR family regulator
MISLDLYFTNRLNNQPVKHMQHQDAKLDATFAALADPTRRAILARLALGETSVTDLARPFDMTMPAISKHLKVLEKAGLIDRGRDAQSRPARLNPAALKLAAVWIDEYRKYWEESFDRLEAYLQKLKADQKRKPSKEKQKP